MSFFFLLAGIVYAVTSSFVLYPLRKAVSMLGNLPTVLIYCTSCTGFWVGGALEFFVPGAWPFVALLWAPLDAAIGSMAAGAVWNVYVPSGTYRIEQGADDDATQEN